MHRYPCINVGHYFLAPSAWPQPYFSLNKSSSACRRCFSYEKCICFVLSVAAGFFSQKYVLFVLNMTTVFRKKSSLLEEKHVFVKNIFFIKKRFFQTIYDKLICKMFENKPSGWPQTAGGLRFPVWSGPGRTKIIIFSCFCFSIFFCIFCFWVIQSITKPTRGIFWS